MSKITIITGESRTEVPRWQWYLAWFIVFLLGFISGLNWQI